MIKVDKPLLKKEFENEHQVNIWVKDLGITCDYFFKLKDYMYARFDHKGKHFVEGVPIK
jgi:hypothetical protein